MRRASAAVAAAGAPWVLDGIDYGPARAALGEIARWALDIAAKNVADWPAALARVEKTRKAILAHLAGKHDDKASAEDILFTAQLLARIFDDDLDLELSEAFQIFDALDLPIDVLALDGRARRSGSRTAPTQAAPTPTPTIVHVRCPTCPMPSAPAAPVAAPLIAPMLRPTARPTTIPTAAPLLRFTTPPPLSFCDDCGYVHEHGDHVRYRNAA